MCHSKILRAAPYFAHLSNFKITTNTQISSKSQGTLLIKAISSHILHPPTFKKCFKWKRVSITWTLRSWGGHVTTACWSSRIQKFDCHSNSLCAASFWFMLKSECCNEEFVNSFATSICATNFRTVWILLIFALKIILLLFIKYFHASIRWKVNILSEILCHRNQWRSFSLRLRSTLMSTSLLAKYTLEVFECASDCVACYHFLKMTKWRIFWCKWERYFSAIESADG